MHDLVGWSPVQRFQSLQWLSANYNLVYQQKATNKSKHENKRKKKHLRIWHKDFIPLCLYYVGPPKITQQPHPTIE